MTKDEIMPVLKWTQSKEEGNNYLNKGNSHVDYKDLLRFLMNSNKWQKTNTETDQSNEAKSRSNAYKVFLQ